MMTAEEFQREKEYQTVMCIVQSMRKNGIISQSDYEKIKTLMIEKYNPLLGSLVG